MKNDTRPIPLSFDLQSKYVKTIFARSFFFFCLLKCHDYYDL